jgi:hypothetical protein
LDQGIFGAHQASDSTTEEEKEATDGENKVPTCGRRILQIVKSEKRENRYTTFGQI